MMDQKIKTLMSKLNITEDEARQIIADDAAIDAGEKLFELTPEQQKASKKARQAQGVVEKKARAPRERKEDTMKADVIAAIAELLADMGAEAVDLTNPERQVDFKLNDRKLRIVLSAPRK